MRLGVDAALVDGRFVAGDVDVADGRIVDVGFAPARRGRVAVPGFVDLQVNGFAGVDFLGATTADYDAAGEALLRTGVTAYQPTFITSAEDALRDALRAMPSNGNRPRIIGAHVEGPFLSPERLGTHPHVHRRDPDPDLLQRLLDAGRVTQVTLAPELPGSDELIKRLVADGIVVSAGHSNATSEEAHDAFDRGVSTITHLFNAMRPLLSRDPGIVGAALTRSDVFIQVIVDGHHLADEVVRLVWAAAPGRVALVTDATAAAASNGSSHSLGDVSIVVANGVPMRDDGVLAGTVLTMLDAVRNVHALGVALEDAVAAASSVPARVVGRPDLGALEPGGRADVVVLDDRLEITEVLCGEDVHVVA